MIYVAESCREIMQFLADLVGLGYGNSAQTLLGSGVGIYVHLSIASLSDSVTNPPTRLQIL